MTLTLEKPVSSSKSTEPEPEFHWTVEALYRALDAGAFEHPERLELIQGRIVENMAQDPLHRSMRVRIGRQLRAIFADRLVVIEECPIHIAYDGELTPDVVALHGTESIYETRHPVGKDVGVLVEISNTTTHYDLGEKALIYAAVGIDDYWVVLVKEKAIVVHRMPTEEGYRSIVKLVGSDTLSPLVVPEAAWTIDTLLGKE